MVRMSRVNRVGRVARVGGGVLTPASFSDLFAWYDATRETVADGTALATITDRSGNGRDLTQATGTSQPLLKTGIQSGRNVYRYDGSDDYSKWTGVFTGPATVLCAAKLRTITGANDTIYDGNDNTLRLFSNGGTGWTIFVGAFCTLNVVPDTNFHSFCGVFNGASSSLRLDGTTSSTQDSGGLNFGGITFGARGSPGEYGATDIGEWFAYSGVLSAGDINALMGYLKSKWGTP
jgi:hypothetical protein